MSKTSLLDRQVWASFFDELEQAGMACSENPFDQSGSALSVQEEHQADFEFEQTNGLDTIRLGKVRLNQSLFRRMVLSAYDNRCAISGIFRPELLIAGHIKPWAIDPKNRLNPRNGICLNRLHDSAFENGLMTFTAKGKIIYSSALDSNSREKLISISNREFIYFPNKFRPTLEFIEYHQDMKFIP
ncbi:HNH endonuclease [Oricola indica]|uniref:HNH endonuclease n=1 Tax=Oricola indica TaxID=2872591 RepID=UPI003CCBB117